MNSRFDLQVNKKALQLNLNPRIYGTFAEVGAGQEVARRFFSVGGAAGTVAKSISAYDMTFSDSIYGPCSRYVSQERLEQMLAHEFDLLVERLDAKAGDQKTFFVFANTVAARSFRRHDASHGWMGIRFQSSPHAEPNDIVIHVQMFDEENLDQQEALGIIGVNLVYATFFYLHQPEKLIESLLDDLSSSRLEVDMIRFTGPDFTHVDNRIMSLQLVSQGLSTSTIFRANGEVVQAADIFYKKSILVERGSFRPVTLVTNDMLDGALSMFLEQEATTHDPEVIMEITMQNLLSSGELDLQDFLDRVDILGSLGRTVLISNYGEYYRLVQFLSQYTDKSIGLVLGVPSLREVFDEKYYHQLEGEILEGLGRLFKKNVQMFVYPQETPEGIVTAEDFQVSPSLEYLYLHLLKNHFIHGIKSYRKENLKIYSRDVLAKIRSGQPDWETMVPAEVAEMIKSRKLFGF